LESKEEIFQKHEALPKVSHTNAQLAPHDELLRNLEGPKFEKLNMWHPSRLAADCIEYGS